MDGIGLISEHIARANNFRNRSSEVSNKHISGERRGDAAGWAGTAQDEDECYLNAGPPFTSSSAPYLALYIHARPTVLAPCAAYKKSMSGW